jgi:multidrug efflux pump subunit AcrA (membrane-fusion protein)
MKFNNRQSLLFGVGLGLLIAILVGGGIKGISHFLHRPASAASITHPEQASAATGNTQAQYGGTEPGSTVELSDAEQKAAGVQTSEVRRRQLTTAVSAFGRVEEPESRLSTISARVGGRLDKLYLQYTGQNVQHGQPIAEIYSPELLSASEEYRLALDSRNQLQPGAEPEAIRAADDLVSASRRRLELWGVTGQQIGQIAAGHINPDVTVYATASGTVVERKATQGQYVNAGDVLYSISDLSTVWVKADVYESDLPQIRAGQPVTITSDALPGRTIHGSVEFIEPQASVETRTVPVHIHVANPGMQLRPGMFVRAVFAVHQQDTLAIPRSAVLDTGTHKLVYVAKGNGAFEAREVQTGAPDNDWFPVLSGLRSGEHVVTSGNFLIDSQTRLTGGMTGLFGGSREFTGREASGGASAEAAPNNAKLTYRTDPDPLKGAAVAKFYVQVTDAAGKAIGDARVNVTFVMPAMPSMNMPEMRAAGDLAWDGKEYSGAINVPMAGPWNTTIEATRNGQILASQHARLSAR